MLGFKPSPAATPAPDHGRRPLKPVLGTITGAVATLAATISFFLAARNAIPYSISALPHLYADVLAWLARPFLFAAVHLIIFIIWKLSEHKHHADHRREEEEFHRDKLGDLVRTPSSEILLPACVSSTDAKFANSSVEIEGRVNLMTESAEEGDSMPELTDFGVEIDRNTVELVQPAEEDDSMPKLTDFGVGIDRSTVELVEPAEEDDSMEARWKAILKGGAAPVVKFTLPEGGGLGKEETEDYNQKLNV